MCKKETSTKSQPIRSQRRSLKVEIEVNQPMTCLVLVGEASWRMVD